MTVRVLYLLIVLVLATTAAAQDDDEQLPGLHARYQVGSSVVDRVDPDIVFDWSESAPDERLLSGPFTAAWSGTLLLKTEDDFRFHAFVLGRVRLKLNGQVVLEGESAKPGWITGSEVHLKLGDQPFEASFSRTGDAAQLKVYWSSREFPLEPVPYHQLFQPAQSAENALQERGRVQFDAFRCRNCHGDPFTAPAKNQQPVHRAPSLKHVGVGSNPQWLVEKLMLGNAAVVEPKFSSSGKMPHFGFNRDEAEAVIAALRHQSSPVELTPAAKPKEAEKEKNLQSGQSLIRSVGCIACHTWQNLGEIDDYGGGTLNGIANRRTQDWLSTWLAEPGRLNAHHRMPVFSMTDKERLQIVLALSQASDGSTPAGSFEQPKVDLALVQRGIKLIAVARCAACHELLTPVVDSSQAISLASPQTSWSAGCTQPPDTAKGRPGFPQADLRAIRAYVESSRLGTADRALPRQAARDNSLAGLQVLERKNCLGCHDRDNRQGISKLAAAVAKSDESLTGQQMTLIPPRLNAVGDRMHDASLAEAIRGEQKSPRLNWLRVRMPKFAHMPEEQSALMAHLIGHDRIPDGNPALPPDAVQISQDGQPNAQQILLGRELLGGKGFSCVACHAVKDYTPKVTALGTRGSNLHLIGQRMRTDYFFRWTRSPLRVMPGVEMPNYQRPHEFILPGRLDQQLVAVWQALNDPKLTAPTNPAVVEQLLSVGRDDHPRVVRDVFTVPGTTSETVARAYAIGLPGGNSVLMDLDTCSVRGWTLGDFARQRCEGKRWYWDLAGTVMASQFDERPEILLMDRETSDVIAPETGWTVECRLRNEVRDSRFHAITYDVVFAKNGISHRLKVVDRFDRIENDPSRGWIRTLQVNPDRSVWPWLRNARPLFVHDQFQITARGATDKPPGGMPDSAIRFASQSDVAVASIQYQTALQWQNPKSNPAVPMLSQSDRITSVPGFVGQRLALPRSIMPTVLTWDRRQRLIFTSLKGHLYRLEPQTQSDKESLVVVEEGLAAPYGVIEAYADDEESFLVVAHKPELLRLSLDSRDKIWHRDVLATGWGLTDDYHDWTCGFARDSTGNLFVGLGSDYTFKNRPPQKSRWRGDILRIDQKGNIESIAHGFRYPTGLAIDDQDRLFCTDQQGVQNTFNELNLIQVGHCYGVPSRHEADPSAFADSAAVQIPHPWTRSVNGIVWIPKSPTDRGSALALIGGQMLGCEYNNHMLIRISIQTVGDVAQGAVYPFSKPAKEGDSANLIGPMSIGISPKGEIYVGGFQDAGWVGGLNMGDLVKLTPEGSLPNGIREIRATTQGFEIDFFDVVDPQLAKQSRQYQISGYTRVWKGDYATPDSGNHVCDITNATIANSGRTVALTVTGRKPGHVYDVAVGEIGTESQRTLWPSIGHFFLKRIPD